MALSLEGLLQDLVARGGSDLHLVHASPPCMRVAGKVVAATSTPLESAMIYSLVLPYLSEHQADTFDSLPQVNTSFTIPNLGRFRMNLCKAQGTVTASIRSIPIKIFPLSSLGLPPVVGSLTQKLHGIIFITGPTGSGKSTTMAAMVDHINHTGRSGKVVTIEDPIETLFKPDKCIFVQREVGVDVPSYEVGIQEALRQDPDVLAIGEMRSMDSMKGALLAAETGHLVLTTLHAPDASKTAQRVLSAIRGEDQDVIRDQFCNSLEAVISQVLLPRADGRGLVLAAEVLLANAAMRRMIREGKVDQITDALQTGASQGMISKDSSIKTLFQRKEISRETALAHMRNPDLLGI
ncbi:MAG: PilT/PilU family type 4a pilus ATPase [Elusimicrobiota bacterium]